MASRMGALVSMAVGLLLGAWCAVLGLRLGPAPIACIAVLGLGLFIAVSARKAAVVPARGAWVLFALCAALAGQALTPDRSRTVDVPPALVRLSGTIVASHHAEGAYGAVEVEEGRDLATRQPLAAGARIGVRGLDAPIGARVHLIARTRPSQDFFNRSPHPEWPGSRATDARARLVGEARVIADAPPWYRLAHWLRNLIRPALEQTLSPEGAALARALLLGETGALDTNAHERVRDAGLSHVLAVSGLHVTILAGAIVFLIRRALLRVEQIATRMDVDRLAKALGIPFALGYATFVGDAPSAWRAALTATLAWLLVALGRRPHPIGVTAGAALLLGMIRPDDLSRPGFVLSIVATAALVSAPASPELGWTRAALAVSTRTSVATAPFVLWLFGSVPAAGVLANLVIVPVASGLLLPAVAVHALVALVLPPLSHLSGPFVDVLTRAFLAACSVFSDVPLGHDLPPPDVAQGLALTAASLVLLAAKSWRTRALCLLALLLFVGASELHLRHREKPRDALRATFVDVGQGDAALVDLPDGRLMVIDTGGAVRGGPDPGARVLVPLLRARRRERIDVLVLSHPHPDHYGGMAALLDSFEVGEIWDSGQAESEEADGALARLLARARANGTRVRPPSDLCGREHRFGAASARVIWPCPSFDPGFGPNDNSLVVELSFGGRRLLFTGDVEGHGEHEILDAVRSVDVLKVAHHGSRTSSAASLLASLRPQIAVVSAGRHNHFGHPHVEVWNRIRSQARCAFRTDRDGGVIVAMSRNGAIEASVSRGNARCGRGARASP